ncbi:hypothetical protein ZWY2020_058803 [Hordeum vulgare]|nr:hypothetical protein ZWY2020_058803 [Hordeum vulgare]
MRRSDDVRRSDWRSSRAEGADWRRDDGPSRHVSREAAAAEPDPVLPLEKVWVLVYGLPRGGSAAPRGGKLTHILKAIFEPVGKLITADLTSFEDDGPTQIEILCPAPAEIDGLSLVFYFGSKGRRLTFELESPAPVDQLDPAQAEHSGLGDGA